MTFSLPKLGLTSAVVALVLAIFAVTGPARATEVDAGEYIIDLAFESIEALSEEGLSERERSERFRVILERGLDIDAIAARTLGPYRRRATEAEMAEYVGLLEENIVRRYAIMFTDYKGEKIEAIETRKGRRDTEIVTVRIYPLNNVPPVDVRWVTRRMDGIPKVVDIIVEQVSLVATQKEEFVSVIRKGGGQIEALLSELRERNAELAANLDQ